MATTHKSQREEPRQLQKPIEAQSIQYIKIKCVIDSNQTLHATVNVLDYKGEGVEYWRDIPNYTESLKTVQSAFADVIELRATDFKLDDTVETRIERRYTVYDHEKETRQRYQAAYDFIISRCSTWVPPVYVMGCDHEMPVSPQEAAYIQLMKETGGNWKPA